MLGNLFATLPTARRCRRGPDRRHTERGERRAAHSVPAIGIAILRRVAAPIASVPGQFRPGNIRHSSGPMRSCCNREHHSERPAVRTSRRCSDTFERAATSGITGSPSASGNPRRAVESLRLAGLSRLLPPGRFGLVGCRLSNARTCLFFAGGRLATRLDTPPKRLHQVDNVRALALLWPLDRPTFLLPFEQLF